jgi:hypothetical protein
MAKSSMQLMQSMKKMGSDTDNTDSTYLKKNPSKLALSAGRVVKDMKGNEVGRTYAGFGPTAGRTVNVSKDSEDATVIEGGKKRLVKLTDLHKEHSELLSEYAKRKIEEGKESLKKIAGDTTKYMSDENVKRTNENMNKKP